MYSDTRETRRRKARRRKRKNVNAVSGPRTSPPPVAPAALEPPNMADAAGATVPPPEVMTRDELKAELDLLGVTYSPRARTSKLVALLTIERIAGHGDGGG